MWSAASQHWHLTTEIKTYIVVDGSYKYCSNHKEPIRYRNVKLAMKDVRGMDDFNLWKV